MRHRLLHFTILLLGIVLASRNLQARDLTFEERVEAQRAIERVYYSHQIGATKPFLQAVPQAVLEMKVRTYLKQSVALEQFWRTPVTQEMLQAEMLRMARETKMPGRLAEIYSALGNDAFLVEECLARPVLVDRLTRNFFSSDARIHTARRQEAEELHQRLFDDELGPRSEHPCRTVVEILRAEGDDKGFSEVGDVSPVGISSVRIAALKVGPEEFGRWSGRVRAAVGKVGPLLEEPEAFTIRVVLRNLPDRIRVATYTVPKIRWESWWEEAQAGFDERDVRSVAAEFDPLPNPSPTEGSASGCLPVDTWDDKILGDLPAPHSDQAAVWTGREMIVWAGQGDDFGFVNTGDRYDPVTDTWRRMSRTNAPPGGPGFQAVWTGSRMFVWGPAYLGPARAGLYNPDSDTWVRVSEVDAPTTKTGNSVVWTGRTIIVWGGTDGFQETNAGARYDPVADTWTPTSPLGAPSPRSGHAAVWTGETMIVWGGRGDHSILRSGARYDPETDSWSPISTLDASLGAGSVVWTGNLMLLWQVTSGSRYDPAADSWSPMSTTNAPLFLGNNRAVVWTGSEMILWGMDPTQVFDTIGGRYDPVMDRWVRISTTNAPPATHGGFKAVWTGNLMVVWGGSRGAGPVNEGARYDPVSDAWTPTSTVKAPVPRFRHTAVWTGNRMVVWGGFGSNFSEDSGGRYDPVIDAWTPTSTVGVPGARFDHTAVWTGNEMIVWGGVNPQLGQFGLNSGGTYDPVADTWMPVSSSAAPSARFGHRAIWTGRIMVVWGGVSAAGSRLNSGGRYDPVTDAWTPTATEGSPTGRTGHSAVWTGSVMVVWGGRDMTGVRVNTGARYDPVTDTWTSTSLANAPAPHSTHPAVWTGTEMVVWGGLAVDGSLLNTGGRYDPVLDGWTPTSLEGAPSGRQDHTAVWTGRLIVVWGGRDVFQALDTGGRYDPVADTWAPTSTTNAPTMRDFHTALWTGKMMLVWGGEHFYLSKHGAGYSLGCQPPEAVARADTSVECTSSAGATVELDGSASTDPDSSPGTNDDITLFEWFGNFGTPSQTLLGSGASLSVMLPLGTNPVTLRVTDAEGNSSTGTLLITVTDTTPPTLSCDASAAAECTSPQGAVVSVAAAAADACSPAVGIGNDRTPGGPDGTDLYPLGLTPVNFTATDASGNAAACASVVTVQDTTPPQVTFGLSPALLWPPNHPLVDIAAAVAASDGCSTPAVALTSVTSTEPDDAPGSGDGNTEGDIQGVILGTSDFDFQLRAERDGHGDGRIYEVTYSAVDGSRNTVQARARVMVPHSLGGTAEPLDLSAQENGAGTSLSWDPVPSAVFYKVIRGNSGNLREAGDFIDLGPVACVRAGSAETSTQGHEDREVPPVGESFFYLAAYDDGRDSGYGSATAPKPRVKTAGGCE